MEKLIFEEFLGAACYLECSNINHNAALHMMMLLRYGSGASHCK
jgi:hypothetical protein